MIPRHPLSNVSKSELGLLTLQVTMFHPLDFDKAFRKRLQSLRAYQIVCNSSHEKTWKEGLAVHTRQIESQTDGVRCLTGNT